MNEYSEHQYLNFRTSIGDVYLQPCRHMDITQKISVRQWLSLSLYCIVRPLKLQNFHHFYSYVCGNTYTLIYIIPIQPRHIICFAPCEFRSHLKERCARYLLLRTTEYIKCASEQLFDFIFLMGASLVLTVSFSTGMKVSGIIKYLLKKKTS